MSNLLSNYPHNIKHNPEKNVQMKVKGLQSGNEKVKGIMKKTDKCK